jgi:hypothetical protein
VPEVPEKDSQNKKTEQDKQNRTGRIEQAEKGRQKKAEMTCRIGQSEPDRQNPIGRIGQAEPDRQNSKADQDRQNGTGRKWLPKHGCQDTAAKTRLLG